MAHLNNGMDIKKIYQGSSRCPPAQVLISALSGAGETELGQMLLQCCGASASEGLQVALNDRQRQLAAAAAESLQRSLEAAADGLPWDFWTIDLAAAASTLGEITGATVSEAVLDRVFSRFCIGK
jgi:tRNA modification GTPase